MCQMIYITTLYAERWLISEEDLGNEETEFEAALMAELMANEFEKTLIDQYSTYED
jgi:hypothetical protein